MPTRMHVRPALVLGAAAACWGVGTVISKQVLDDVAPLTLLPVQLLASCAFLAVVATASRRRIRWSPNLARLTALGVLNPGLSYALGLLGLMSITASMSVLIWAIEPVLIAVLAVIVLKDRVPGPLAAAMAVAVCGVLLVVYQPGASGSWAGVGLTVAAVATCALYTVLARRLLLDDASVTVALAQQAAALLFASATAVLARVVTGSGLDVTSMTPRVWFAAAGSGILYYGLAFWLYLAGLRHVPAAVAGAFITLVPVFGLAAGHVVGERLSAHQWAAAPVVLAAVGFIALRRDAEDG